MNREIFWHLENRYIKDLTPYEKNPRYLTSRMESNLINSIIEFGIIDRPCINLDNTIIGGHQRIEVLKKLGIGDVEVLVPSIMLTQEEVEKLNLILNKVGGDWDYDVLANEFDLDLLLQMGFTTKELELDCNIPKANKEEVKFVIKTPTEDANSLETILSQVILSYPDAILERKENRKKDGKKTNR
jgi:hypothetical protein